MESEIELSQVQARSGAPLSDVLDIQDITGRNRNRQQAGAEQRGQAARQPNRENLKIMGKTMIITLLLTIMAGFGIIKLGAFAMESDTVKLFLSQFHGGSSMDHLAASFEITPPTGTSGGPVFGTVPSGRLHHRRRAHMPPQPLSPSG